MVTIKELREKCKKNYWSPWNRMVHEVGFYFTKPFINTKVTSNQITVFWLFLGLLGSWFVLKASYGNMLIGILIFHLANFFDCVDGDLARYRNKSSVKGIYLEQIAHHITIISMLTALTFAVFKIMQNYLWLYLGAVMVGSFVFLKLSAVNLSYYKGESREKIEKLLYSSNPRARGRVTNFSFALVRVEHPGNLMFWLFLFGVPHIALVIYAALYFLEMSRKLANNLKNLQIIDNGK
jgi:phosphatidylglycerophosphate synthase